MAKLTSKSRNALSSSQFALPGQRKYPVNDASHAVRAKGRATQMEKRGVISPSTEAKIDRKANAVLHGGAKQVKNASSHMRKMMHG